MSLDDESEDITTGKKIYLKKLQCNGKLVVEL